MLPGLRPTSMRRLPGAAASLLLGAGLALVPLSSALGCSCTMLNPPSALQDSDVAFVGVVAAIRDPSAGNQVISSMEPIFYTLIVEEPLKGGLIPGQQVTIGTSRDGASCGWSMEVGQRQRLYAETRDGALSTGLCSGNEILAKGVPVPQIAGSRPESGGLPLPLLAAAGAIALLSALSALAFVRWGGGPSARP